MLGDMTTKTMKVEGLKVFEARTPFADRFSAMLDYQGAWTIDMFENCDDELGATGLTLWEGSCEITMEDEGTEDEYRTYEFSGACRAPSSEELRRLADGRMPLRDIPFPDFESLIENPSSMLKGTQPGSR